MAELRRPIDEISGNIPKQRELTLCGRAQITGAAKCGVNLVTAWIRIDTNSLRTRTQTAPRPGCVQYMH